MNKIDVFDKILKENSWKFPKGYPDINDKEDKDLLESIISSYLSEEEDEVELEDDKEILNIKSGESKDPSGGSQTYNDTIRYALYQGKDWKGKPIPRPNKKYPFQNNSYSFSVDGSDMEMFRTLYPVKPPKVGKEVGSAGSLGVGNGEIFLYWLYHFSDSAKVDEGRDGDDPDLFFDKKGVEVKSWSKHPGIHGLGRFGADKENLNLLAIIFGFNALSEILGDSDAPKTVNPYNFTGPDLVNAMEKVLDFKEILTDELSSQYPLFSSMKSNIDKLYNSFEFKDGSNAESMAAAVASKIALDKLTRKPGDGNHLVNITANGDVKFFYIEFDKLEGNPDILSDFRVRQSAIDINFDKIWG